MIDVQVRALGPFAGNATSTAGLGRTVAIHNVAEGATEFATKLAAVRAQFPEAVAVYGAWSVATSDGGWVEYTVPGAPSAREFISAFEPSAGTYTPPFWRAFNGAIEVNFGGNPGGFGWVPDAEPALEGTFTVEFVAEDFGGVYAGANDLHLVGDYWLYLDWSAAQGLYVALERRLDTETVYGAPFAAIDISGDVGPVTITPSDPLEPHYGITPLPGGQSIVAGLSYALTVTVTAPA